MAKPKKKTGSAEKYEKKGDEYLAKKKPEKALKEYQKAFKKDPSLKGLYDKLTKAKDAIPGDWELKDFVESVDWTMKKQETESPRVKQVHARLSPEWTTATKFAIEILGCTDEDRQTKLVENLAGMGEIATRAVIGLLIEFKNKSSIKQE